MTLSPDTLPPGNVETLDDGQWHASGRDAVGRGGRSLMADPSASAPAGTSPGREVPLATKLQSGRRRVCAALVFWWRHWADGLAPGAECPAALGQDFGKRRCWLTGPAATGGGWRGWGRTAMTATRPGSGATRGRAGPGPAGAAGGWGSRPTFVEGLATGLIDELAADPGPNRVLLALTSPT